MPHVLFCFSLFFNLHICGHCLWLLFNFIIRKKGPTNSKGGVWCISEVAVSGCGVTRPLLLTYKGNTLEKGRIGTLGEGMCVHSSMRNYQLSPLGGPERERMGQHGNAEPEGSLGRGCKLEARRIDPGWRCVFCLNTCLIKKSRNSRFGVSLEKSYGLATWAHSFKEQSAEPRGTTSFVSSSWDMARALSAEV